MKGLENPSPDIYRGRSIRADPCPFGCRRPLPGPHSACSPHLTLAGFPTRRSDWLSCCCRYLHNSGVCLGTHRPLPWTALPPLLCGQLGFVTSDKRAKECQPHCSEVGSFTPSTGTMFFQPRHNHAFESKLLPASGRTTEAGV